MRKCPGLPEGLLAIIGHEQRDRVVAESADEIARCGGLDLVGLGFLIEVGQVDAAEAHILKHGASLNGDDYGWLLPIAQAFEASGKVLSASLVYRSLLESILRRARSTIYSHAVRYLRKLDKLAGSIPDWGGYPPHGEYKISVRQTHALKRSFWSRYEK